MQKNSIATPSADVLDLHVRFPLKISIFVSLVTVLLSGLYYWETGSAKETLVFLGASIVAAGAVLAAIYTARTLNLQLEAAAAQKELDRRRHALSFASRWNDSGMLETRKTCREIVNMKYRGLDDLRISIGSGQTQDSVIHLLNFFEEISISIDEGVADPRVLDDFFAEVCFQTWATLEGWIGEYRTVRGAKNLWGGLEKLNARWKQH